jgi:hypothetical protein
MNEALPPRRRPGRLVLALTALLYFGGASLGPWLHALQAGVPGKQVTHSELACGICQALDATAAPEAEPRFEAVPIAGRASLPRPVPLFSAARRLPGHARAPPPFS